MSATHDDPTALPVPVVSAPTTGRRLNRVFWLAFTVLMLVTTAWSLASPIAAGPDENAHIVKAAAVVRGDLRGTSSTDNIGAGEVAVPQIYAFLLSYPVCFAFRGEEPADCTPPFPDEATGSVTTTADTWVIRNNPLYYAIVGLPTLLPAAPSVIYLMRLISAALCSLILAWGVRSIAELTRRPLLILGFVAALTPMVIFLNSVVNPSALEISASLTLWVALLALVRAPDPSRITSRAAGIAVITVLLVNSRGLSPLYVAVIAATIALVGPWSGVRAIVTDRRTWPWMGLIAIGTAASLWWTSSAGTLAAGGSTHPELGFLSTANRTFFDTGDFLVVSIGRFGWLDTDLPLLVTLVFVALIGLPTLLALSLGGRRDRLATLGVIAVAVGLPVVLHAWQARYVGYIWTARYSLPLTVGVVVVAGFVLRDALAGLPRWISDRLTVTIVWLLGAGQLIAFAYNLRRYVVGSQGSWRAMFHGEWAPPVPVAVLLLGQAIVLAVGVVLVLRLAHADDVHGPDAQMLAATAE